MTPKISRYLASERPETPCLVVDLDQVESNYERLRRALPSAQIYYAVKANPAAPVLERLTGLGSHFDAASIFEVESCLEAGADAARLSFGNTIKKAAHIARAHALGVDLFAFDAEEELIKLAENAPGARVYCRLLVENKGADWPLSRKFGCAADMAKDLLLKARDLGLVAHGVSFHVGSQQTDPDQWQAAIADAAMVFTDLREQGVDLRMLNLGGGFPVRYRRDVPSVDEFAEAIMSAMHAHFGNAMPDMIIEPGRSIIADAGVLETEVVLVSRKTHDDKTRWVYLDVGLFGGLAECMGEAIQYDFVSDRDGDPTGPVHLAGPTCDGADILYEKADYRMPLSLKAGDKLRIESAGAYTSTYASVGFNGFPPPTEVYL
ncbi:type III PLP-dependent enzyme [Magnetospira sp. QH-2]|uniref:type III PLP-dependent enzyme n=1 Tax=Magnetospira sp. (strain QH-2) TaxID=1288970 RepID=UPI0003E80A79|nr:type III PLP-dependent enzyme [Magnetospira sp. QH-2]CCQ74399.1 putative ornithine decarboxylase [Magnetospira sp. QH-2]